MGLAGWIGSFLQDFQATLCMGNTSISHPLTMGVPQGSPLFPVLFLVFINYLLCSLATRASIQAFTDHIVIWWTVGTGETGNALGNTILDLVLAWDCS